MSYAVSLILRVEMHLSRRTDDFGVHSGKKQPWQSPRAVCRLFVCPKTRRSRRAFDVGFGPVALVHAFLIFATTRSVHWRPALPAWSMSPKVHSLPAVMLSDGAVSDHLSRLHEATTDSRPSQHE